MTARDDLIAALPGLDAILALWSSDPHYVSLAEATRWFKHAPALLAAVRECEELRTRVAKDSRHQKREQWAVLETERDALRAENERLRGELARANEHLEGMIPYGDLARLRRVAEAAKRYRKSEMFAFEGSCYSSQAAAIEAHEGMSALDAALADAPEEPT